MSRLSIVIPCLGDAAEFDGALVSVLQHRPADCEVLVVHRQPYDDPYGLNGEVRFLQCAGKSLVELLNAALEETTGEIVHVIGCGIEATDGWTKAVLPHFDDPEVAAAAPIIMSSDGQQIVAAGIGWTLGGARRAVTDRRVLNPGSGRLRAKIIAPPLIAGFYRREVLTALGGFESHLGDELADVACGFALRALEQRTVLEPSAQLIQAIDSSPSAIGSLTRGSVRERLFWRFAAQQGMARSLALHAVEVVREMIAEPRGGGILLSMGRCLGLASFGDRHRYHLMLEDANNRLAELTAQRAKRSKRLTIPSATTSGLRKAA